MNIAETKKTKNQKKRISFKDKSRIFSHGPGADPMKRKILEEQDAQRILKKVFKGEKIKKKEQLLELLNTIIGFVASFFPIYHRKTPGKTDEIALLIELEKSINKSSELMSILHNQYGQQTYSLLSIVDHKRKVANTNKYLEDTIKQLQGLTYSIQPALNKLKWCGIFIAAWNKKKSPTDEELEMISKKYDGALVLIKTENEYILWAKKKKTWKSTELPFHEATVFQYLDFNKKGKWVSLGNQFKDPHKIEVLKNNHSQLKNLKGKKRGNNSQDAIPQLIAHLTKLYKEITGRDANSDLHHGKLSTLGFNGRFYDFVREVLIAINKNYKKKFPSIENPFKINLGKRTNSDYPSLSLSRHMNRTLKAMRPINQI